MNASPSTRNINVSVCITSFSIYRLGLLKELIRSLEKQRRDCQAELVILIERDASLHSEVQDNLSRCSIPSTLVFSRKHVGLSEGRNICARHARGEVVSFVDDDVVAGPSWLENVYRFFKKHPDAKVLGGTVEPRWLRGTPDLGEDMYWLVGCTPYQTSSQQGIATSVIGSNMNIRKDVFLKVGQFNEEVGFSLATSRLVGGEDLDLCLRVQKAFPNSIYFDPGVRVIHQIPPAKLNRVRLLRRAFWFGFGNAYIRSSHGLVPINRSYLAIVLRHGLKDLFRSFERNLLRLAILLCIFSGSVFFTLSKSAGILSRTISGRWLDYSKG